MLSSGTIFCKPHHRPEPRLPGMLFPISLRFSNFSEIRRMKTPTSPISVGLFKMFFFNKVFVFQEVISGTWWGDVMTFIISVDRSTGEIWVWNVNRKIKPQSFWWAGLGFVLPSLDDLAKMKTWKAWSAVSTEELFWNKSPGVIELAMSITWRRGKEEGEEDNPSKPDHLHLR